MEQGRNIFLFISRLIKSSSQDESLEKDWYLVGARGLCHLVSIDGPGEVRGRFGEVWGAGETHQVARGQLGQAGAVLWWDLRRGGGEHNDQEVSVLALRPEDRGLGAHLAPVAARGGHAEVGEVEDRGVAQGLQDVDPRPGEDRERLGGAGEEPEYLQPSLVPLDAVHLLPLAVVLTHQAGRLTPQTEGRNFQLGQSEGQGLLAQTQHHQEPCDPRDLSDLSGPFHADLIWCVVLQGRIRTE